MNAQQQVLPREIAGDQSVVSEATGGWDSKSSTANINQQEQNDTYRFRLSLEQIGLVGRVDERAQLNDAFGTVKEMGDSQFIFVKGPAGVGKSKLVENLRNHVFQQEGLYVSANFDRIATQQPTPFSALASTFSDLCDLLLQNSKQKSQTSKAVKKRMGNSEILALNQLIPSFGFVFHDEVASSGEVFSESEPSVQATTKFKRLCRIFLECISTSEHPVVLVLDDLQWADEASLDLIQALMKRSLKHTLIIGLCQTSSEVESPILDSFLDDCGSEAFPLTFKEIHVPKLNLDDVNQILSTITKRNPAETLPLSRVVSRKTNGNAFFCMQFLEMLQEINLIRPASPPSLEWRWNEEQIVRETDATDNVADLVIRKLNRLEPSVRLVLVYAAHIGYHFKLELLEPIVNAEAVVKESRGSILDELWKALQKEGSPHVTRAITKASIEHLIECDSSDTNSFKFSHYRIQEALLAMMGDADDRASFYLRAGRVTENLVSMGQLEDTEGAKFLAADFLNEAVSLQMDDFEKLGRVTLNMEVAELAISKEAYSLSRDYLRHAVGYLPTDSWATHYDLTLRVHNRSAEMECCTGFPERGREIVDTVIAHATRYSRDTMSAYQTLVASLTNLGRMEEGVNIGFDALRKLKVKLPKPSKITLVHIIVEIVQTQHAMKNHTMDDLLHLPLMTDKDMLAVFSIMSAVGSCAYCMAQKGRNVITLLSLRLTRLVLTHGLTNSSHQSLVLYGSILCALGKIDAGCKFADLALRLNERLYSPKSEARMLVATICCLRHWDTPFEDLHSDMMRGYNLAMDCADITFASFHLATYLDTAFCFGILPFSEIRALCQSAVDLAHEFKIMNVLPNVLALYQATLNLMGDNEGDAAILIGEVANADELIAKNDEVKNDVSTSIIQLYQLAAAYHFERIDLMEKLTPLVEKGHKANRSVFIQRIMMFYVGLSSFLLYHRTEKKHHFRRGRRMLSQFQVWHAKGYANNVPMVQILEMMMHKNDSSYHQVAVDAAANVGLCMNWAIAHERGAELTGNEAGNREMKVNHVSAAIELYQQLEMDAKVDFLNSKYRSILGRR